jgi:glycerol-3-phosphate acyltransferase PlsY
MACLTWLAMALIYRYSSLAALIALAIAPFYALLIGRPDAAVAFSALGLLGWIRHHANLTRLVRGEEPKIGAKKKA